MLRHLFVLLLAVSASAQDAPDAGPPAIVDPTVRTDGTLAASEVLARIDITYDGFGVPTVTAESRADAYFAEGFLHAQNRFTQMEVTRRMAAGELAALVGRAALDQDISMRSLQLRDIARRCLEQFDPVELELLRHYSAGVNAGLSDLSAPPPEYAILQTTPEAWKPEDTILVVLSFCVLLDSSGDDEIRNAAMFESLPEEVREFIYDPISRFDAPIPGLERRRPSIPRIPGREVISLRDLPDPPPVIEYRYDIGDDDDGPGGSPDGEGDGEGRLDSEKTSPGSNNWGISGRLTTDGRAILASDPHLPLLLPSAWYRLRLEWPDHDLVGISIPGIPGITMGSNGHVAWGFTNLTGDLQDLIALEIDPDDSGRYRTVDGWESFGGVVEMIEIAGEEPHQLDLKTTRWGTVNAEYLDNSGATRLAVREWAPLNPELVNLNLLTPVEDAHSIEEALDALASWNGPPQNAVVVDSNGEVGYTITGFLPDRARKDGRGPYGLWDGTPSWTERAQIERPRLSGESVDFVFTANNRTIDNRIARKLGYAWANPARARRIKDVLERTTQADEQAMLELQMDSTTVGLDPWKRLILDAIPEGEQDEQLAAAREALLAWNGRADVDQVGITLLDSVRGACLQEISVAVATWAEEKGIGRFDSAYINEEPYLRVIEDQAENWLPPGEAETWQEWMRDHVRRAVDSGGLSPWGDSNQITIRSPFADMAPAPMQTMLELRSGPQSGYWNAPKVLMPGFGASARLVVSPSHEADGFLLTPGGQSGNPLSPHYRSLNESWLAGDPVPLLPGEPVASFSLIPGSEDPVPAN